MKIALMKAYKNVLQFFFLCTFTLAQAQYGRTYQEIGIMGGPVFFQGDFGERGDLDNTIKNVGFSGSLVYFLSLNVNRSSFAENFKLRFDFTGMAVNMQHYGKYADANSTTGKQLRAMRSDVKVGSLGVQLEFYPWKTDDYSDATWSPYIATGAQINNYTAEAYSFQGNIGNSNVVPTKYVDGFKNSNGTAFSATGSVGIRYKLTDYNYLILEGQMKYYFSDWIEGMNPARETYKENKTNDYTGTINIGYIYYFN
jgi:hypothetical protein